MSISADAARLQEEVLNRAEADPVLVSRYILTDGDGINTANIYSWYDSFRAEMSELARSVWFAITTDGQASKHIFFLTVPASAFPSVAPAVGQKFYVLHLDGASYGPFKCNFVDPLRYNGYIFAYQIVIEASQ